MLTPDPQTVRDAVRAFREPLYGSDAENRQERERQIKVLTEWHVHMFESTSDPILRALIEAHGPQMDDFWPNCAECPEVPANYGDIQPESWPCAVWTFISDRMEVSK